MDTALKDLLWNIVKSHVTKGLTFLAGVLVTKGVIEENQSAPLVSGFVEIVMGGVVFVVSSAVTIYLRYRDQVKVAIAARLPAGVSLDTVNDEAAKNTTPLKALLVLLAVGASIATVPACGKRYAPGTPTQNKLAYELEQGLGIVLETQTKLIAAVDSGVTTKALADRFLVPARDLADLAKNRIIPSLKAYDAAVTAGDLNAQKLLTAELTPMVRQFNQLAQTAFGASLPDNVVGSLGKLLQQLQQTIRTVLQEFTPDQVPAAA